MTQELATTTTIDPCCSVTQTNEDGEALSRAAAVFKALSDETRLRILRAVARTGQACECEIVPSFGLSQPTISYHLKVLREAGLIESERRGQWVYHRLNQRAVLGVIREMTGIGS